MSGAPLPRPVTPVETEQALQPAVSPLQAIADKVLLGEALSAEDARALASAAPHEAPQLTDAHMQALTQQMLDQRDALLAEHGLSLSYVSAFLKERGASAEAIAVGGLSRAELEAHMSGAPLPRPVTPVETEQVLQPAASPLQAIADKVLLGEALSAEDARALASAAPHEAPQLTDAHMQALTQQMLDQRDALLAEHGLSLSYVSAFLKERGASAEAIAVGGLSRAELEQHFPAGSVGVGAAAKGALAVAEPLADVPLSSSVSSAPAGGPKWLPERLRGESAEAEPLTGAVGEGDTPGPRAWTREAVMAHQANKGSFAGEDLSGLDLSQLDLSGADFSGSTLETTRFNGGRLAGARFDRAQMPQADLSDVDAAQASFAQARAAAAVLTGARLPGAVLDAADFSEADFRGALLEGANCARTDFQRARMDGLMAAGSRAPQAVFDGAEMANADLRQAVLEGARFNEAKLAGAKLVGVLGARSEWFGTQAMGADFSGAQLGQARGGSAASFAQARFDDASLAGAVWEGVSLQGALLRNAQLTGADFSGAQAAGAQLDGADARGARFSRAQLAGASLARVNLMGASLRRADLAQASLAGSNLHGGDLQAVRMDRSDLRGALTTATVLAIDGRPETQGMVA